jgi:hypothetical protein
MLLIAPLHNIFTIIYILFILTYKFLILRPYMYCAWSECPTCPTLVAALVSGSICVFELLALELLGCFDFAITRL